MKIKNSFLNLSTKKTKEIQKVINKLKKNKSKFNITTKVSSRRLVLVLMNLTNSNKFIVLSYKHIANINRAFKNIKSNTMTSFI